jgi:AmpE protein
MYFIAVLIMFGMLQYWGSFASFQKDAWFFQILEKSQAAISHNGFVYVISVLLPCLFLVAVLVSIRDWMWGFVSLLLAVAVLVYALGRKEYTALMNEYVKAWKQGEYEKLPVIMAQLDDSYSADLGEGLQRNHVEARESYIYAAFEGLFVVLFWFVLLGPAGALLYRLNSFYVAKTQWKVAHDIQAILERPAAFVLGLTFALMGDFGRAIPTWSTTAFNRGMTAKNVVHANALAAIGLDMDWLKGEFNEKHTLAEQGVLVDGEIESLINLVRRSLIFAVFLMAVFQIVM